MEKNRFMAVAILIVVVCVGVVGAYVLLGSDNSGPKINASRSIDIVKADPGAAAYHSSHFKVEDWRVTETTLVDSTPNGTVSDEGVWKVEIMERSCACSGVKDLYVIEGYVSASSGELLEVSTKSVLESEYEKSTCSSTACH